MTAKSGSFSSSHRSEIPPFRYAADLANQIEQRHQDRWESLGIYRSPNPSGPLTGGAVDANRPKLYVLDMFPYPSGSGLHVGHPLGYIGTDVFARFKRMQGFNVLHAMGYDAFGLPAEQYAVQTGKHPRATTEANIANMRRQFRAMGLGHDDRRSVATTDVEFYRWTQWIFLQLFNAWFDPATNKARPIADLIAEYESEDRMIFTESHPHGKAWSALSELERRQFVDDHRLVYLDEAPVNWCPGLGTVLANEEVTADGRSERGNFPVFKRPLKQWKMRITSYAERLLEDLDLIDWPEPIKLMQRNWIGRSEGASVLFPIAHDPNTSIEVFTTRPDTLFGATYMVLAPEHPLVEQIVAGAWPANIPSSWRGSGESAVVPDAPLTGWESPSEAVGAYLRYAQSKSDVERQVESRVKTGVFTGAFAINPTNGEHIPVFIADYVLMGYGTGAIMAVPAHDERDFDFAKAFDLPIVGVVQPSSSWFERQGLDDGSPSESWPEAFTGDGLAMSSANAGVTLDGLDTPSAKSTIVSWLEAQSAGAGTINYKLRDWLFSRQRYWGEPFPIVYDDQGLPLALPESMLPVELPEIEDYAPVVVGEGDDSVPEPPLGRATDWVNVTLDLGDGPKSYRRELNTMPQWAGSCWYYLRYLDPTNDAAFVDPDVERYWMQSPADGNGQGASGSGGVDLYVGGVEHAVLHLLYSRFWHKVLFDLGHVSTPEPFQRLYNQGYILAPAYVDARGVYVPAEEVQGDVDSGFTFNGEPVTQELGKMGKSLKNSVDPETIYGSYGADTLRLYEMAMGPLDADRPWNARDITGVHRFLQRLWRNLVDEETGELRVVEEEAPTELRRLLHRTIASVADDMNGLRFNTAVAKLIELNNALTKHVNDHGSTPKEVAETTVLMLAPLAPHVCEELWEKLGNKSSVVWESFPKADQALLAEDEIEIPVQVDGKIKARIKAAPNASQQDLQEAAMAHADVIAALGGRAPQRVIVVPGRLINIVG